MAQNKIVRRSKRIKYDEEKKQCGMWYTLLTAAPQLVTIFIPYLDPKDVKSLLESSLIKLLSAFNEFIHFTKDRLRDEIGKTGRKEIVDYYIDKKLRCCDGVYFPYAHILCEAIMVKHKANRYVEIAKGYVDGTPVVGELGLVCLHRAIRKKAKKYTIQVLVQGCQDPNWRYCGGIYLDAREGIIETSIR
jgi:hypothetical protein